MLLIKRKLSSKAGASMLLAMVFLMFCLFIGGSVLAAATANGSRVDHLKNDQQDYLSQRSAMLLMSEMLTGKDGEELQVIITDVTTATAATEGAEAQSKRTVTFTCPTLSSDETPSILQKMLFEIIVAKIVAKYKGLENTTLKMDTLKIAEPTNSQTNLLNGTISTKVKIGDSTESLSANYSVNSSDYSVTVTFGTDSFVTLTMDGSIGTGSEKIVTIGDVTTTTQTTVIRWDAPVIEKRGA